MPLNKDIIIRVVLGFIFFIFFVKVMTPILFELFKGKISGGKSSENDIDMMIRRQKEKLKAEYGLTEKGPSAIKALEVEEKQTPAPTKEIEALYKESRWGGGEFAKSIQNEIAKNYSYTLAETKVNAFVLLAEKRHYLKYLSVDNQKSNDAIKNYLSLVMLNLMMIEEIREKNFSLIEKAAKKCHTTPMEFALALQLKILNVLHSKREMKEERLFVDSLTLHQYSDESMKEAMDLILKKEANLWAKGHSQYFEELSLFLTYADILINFPKFQSKKDVDTAYIVLGIDPDSDTEEIKKAYKKLAMLKHPDKIGQMKLPKILEKKALIKFSQIQEAYEIIMAHRKK